MIVAELVEKLRTVDQTMRVFVEDNENPEQELDRVVVMRRGDVGWNVYPRDADESVVVLSEFGHDAERVV